METNHREPMLSLRQSGSIWSTTKAKGMEMLTFNSVYDAMSFRNY